eukprot:SAG31_NODE_1867_length_7029_cov_11.400433_2_plen_234_part_00
MAKKKVTEGQRDKMKRTVLSAQRANNMMIVLKKIGLTNAGIADAILRGDAVVLNEAAIEGLLSVLPTDDELQLVLRNLRTLAKDACDAARTSKAPLSPRKSKRDSLTEEAKLAAIQQLAEVDQFVLHVGAISGLAAKLKYLQLQQHFPVQVGSVEGLLSRIRSACEQMKDSKRLQQLLMIVLKIGNALHSVGADGSHRAGRRKHAYGFRLSDLRTFSSNQSITLPKQFCLVFF